MGHLSATELARIQAQITAKEAQLAAANDAYTAALTDGHIQSYKFDSGEGSQQTTRRRPSDLAAEVNRLEQDLNRLYRRIDGGSGVVTMNLRRRG